jgi:hypothetical protein
VEAPVLVSAGTHDQMVVHRLEGLVFAGAYEPLVDAAAI